MTHGQSDCVNTSTLLSIYKNPQQAIICSQDGQEDDKEFERLFWFEYKGKDIEAVENEAGHHADGLLIECEQCGQNMTMRQWSKHSGSCTERVCILYRYRELICPLERWPNGSPTSSSLANTEWSSKPSLPAFHP